MTAALSVGILCRVTAISDAAAADDTTAPSDDEPDDAAALGPASGWERLGLAVLLVGTAVAYLWNISVNAMGNSFYAASVQAGAQNWKALLFGSLDTGNFITVDKPPVSQWVMGLSGQIFGFNSTSMLVPEALMAVGAVALLYGAVTRVCDSRGAGLLAGATLAVTPVAALMFRFNNPDAVMVLSMTAAAYCTVRALQRGSGRWLVLAGVALGGAFLAKMLEGLMVLPALAIAYLIVAPNPLRTRLLHLLAAAAALVVSSGWYVLLTILWPASSRPYLAGSADNTFMDLVLGYNGFARFLGHNNRHIGQGFEPPAGFDFPQNVQRSFGGNNPGVMRMFNGEIGFEISWLIPAALVAFVVVLVARRRAQRTDLVRGAALVFGLWLSIDGIAFTTMKGGMHAYYTMAIAPAVAGMFAVGVHEMWRRRAQVWGRLGAAALIVAACAWGFVVLQRNPEWLPWLRWALLVVGVFAALGLAATALPAAVAVPAARLPRWTSVAIVVGVLAGLGGSTAYAVATLPEKHVGGSPRVGPARQAERDSTAGVRRDLGRFMGGGQTGKQLDAMLRKTTTTWSAAVDRSSAAAAIELSSETAVMAIGGFTSRDPVPTLARFQQYVRDRQVSYYLAQDLVLPSSWRTSEGKNQSQGQRRPGRGGWWPGGHKDIADWVAANFASTKVGDMTVYDLAARIHSEH